MSIVYGVRFGMAVYGVAAEMEALVSQSERGLEPGCAECEQLENQLIAAREQDRRERNREMRHESPALRRFHEHRQTHE